jgi:hypothetical protein
VLSAETISGIKVNYAKFAETIAVAEPLYLIYEQSNFDALRKWLFEHDVTDDLLAQANGEHLYPAAFVALKAEGKLKFAPNAEERAEQERKRVVELNRRDREAGSHTANAPWRTTAESPAESVVRLAKQMGGESAERTISNAEAIKAAQAAEDAQYDFSSLPTLSAIIEGGGEELPLAEQKAMSRFQMREYRRRLNDARAKLSAARKKN